MMGQQGGHTGMLCSSACARSPERWEIGAAGAPCWRVSQLPRIRSTSEGPLICDGGVCARQRGTRHETVCAHPVCTQVTKRQTQKKQAKKSSLKVQSRQPASQQRFAGTESAQTAALARRDPSSRRPAPCVVCAQTFIKTVNYNHLMPTRYTLDVDFKGVTGEVLENSTKKVEANKVRGALQRSQSGGTRRDHVSLPGTALACCCPLRLGGSSHSPQAKRHALRRR